MLGSHVPFDTQVLSVDAQGEVTEVFSKSVNECIQGVKVPPL